CDVECVIRAADDPEVAVFIDEGEVAREVASFHLAVVRVVKSFGLFPERAAEHRERLFDDEISEHAGFDRLSVIIYHRDIDAEEHATSGACFYLRVSCYTR